MYFYCLNLRLFYWGDYRDEVLILAFIKFFLQGFFMESVSRKCTALFLYYITRYSIWISYVLLVSLFCLQICTSIYTSQTIFKFNQRTAWTLKLFHAPMDRLWSCEALGTSLFGCPLSSQMMCNNIAVQETVRYILYKKLCAELNFLQSKIVYIFETNHYMLVLCSIINKWLS